MLGVEKNCTENDLKKAFKRKAIKVHPDKNPAP
jgi:curved DNA-binding protein CbpA